MAKAGGGSDLAQLALAPRPLGLLQLADFAWRVRDRAGGFAAARAAEAKGDWAGVLAACDRVIAADPEHLECQWLAAIAHAKRGELDAVTEPLELAVAGDYGKWGPASLAHPALAAFRAAPVGTAWRQLVASEQTAYAAALGRALLVDAGGELFAWDLTANPPRWYQLTHEHGRMIAAFAGGPGGHRVAYVVRQRGAKLAVGAVDLDDGRETHAVPVASLGAELAVAASPAGLWIGPASGHAPVVVPRQLALDGAVAAAVPKRPAGAWLYVGPTGSARAVRVPIAGVAADWDERGLASAIQLAATGRVITVPSPGVIAGNTLAWSPDRARVAFVAQLAEQCAPGKPALAAFVADVATGTAKQIETAAKSMAVQWTSDRQLAIAADGGVVLQTVAGGAAPIAVPGATGLAIPPFRPRCAPEPALGSDAGSDLDDAGPAVGSDDDAAASEN